MCFPVKFAKLLGNLFEEHLRTTAPEETSLLEMFEI